MAIQKKHGKGRLDKWYKLAKEKGYRARAAFKLIQLNKKYGFLEKSRVLLDLCAAPGSWCQVAAETMPAQSLIVGVDLAPIKPIPRVITFQSDITTDKCRATIRGHLKHLKADAVLHDGAPNVGVAWVQDAFSQAELVLQSMKLATEFLKEGGTFVTKVFRSKDYNALLGFKAPKRMDPKFLDPKHVFAEVQEATPNNEAKVFNPEKKKRKREGYEEGDYTQHKVIPVSEYIHTTDPIAILGTVNKLSFEQGSNGDLALAALDRLPETTEEIRKCCEDLKVLGKKEFRTLLRWRLKVRDKFGMSTKAKKQQEAEAKVEGDEVAEVQPMDEELKIQEELQRLKDQGSKKKRKERRRENEKKQKEIVRMQMHMTTPREIGLEQNGPMGEGAMFNIKTSNKARDATKITEGPMEQTEALESEVSEEESEDEVSDPEADNLEEELDSLYHLYREKREENDAKARAKRARKERETDEWTGLSDDGEGQDNASDAESDAEDQYSARSLPKAEGLSTKAAMFFDQDIFQDLGLEDDEDDKDSAIELEDGSSDQAKSAATQAQTQAAEPQQNPLKSALKKTQPPSKQAVDDESDSDAEAVPKPSTQSTRAEDPLLPNGQLDVDIITAEAMTLAQSLATKQTKSSDLIDDSFNKYSFRDVDGLPEWFLDDETQHSKQLRPITAAGAAAIKEKLRALNARPIKKVMEAKGRKKFKAAQRLEKLRRKSALLLDDEGISEKDKAASITRMMARAAKKGRPKEKVKVVVARGGNRGISGRPRGVKGRYKIVDARLKKDARAEKRLKKKLKK
ncbi:AdoMet-dependent rRNA methyltransferase spb1 [Elasticomyces elasticus]|uniref:AdoMet-dependent rRNA methyltransferase spb1 n=1 Tax=Exophiala sideris TaxID=1016849 RepID=A0ABR0J1M0_9EURO|nr:AdoMet-dependent rRNA methyltransferase spb1 [Elasticomyces elasticus]KAK5024643.1 AdoMet-dependent rRNA methyltransferase spb1 [Exophiala sideris]KAK5030736.1 AdoMet-dependent rRNA methyltransferase spb1 [Exophiala sideris]KAK5054276.1 AdoMet-dependent rRNA methyltransferase spb1 [Exophiala sideris]KAK5179678.1 AdoMet-dependent rRNA methyltransferase spb1 [Eurotiomycetes sp. CCFEE 6388]